MAVAYFGRGDVIWYQIEDEPDIRAMLECEFGGVCKEHSGWSKKNGFGTTGPTGSEVWGYWTHQKGSAILPCFRHGGINPYRKLPLLFTSE